MAKLTALPEQSIISGFKGVVDFYVHRGINCARAWPKNHLKNRGPRVRAQWPLFTLAASGWTTLSPQVQEAYRRMAPAGGYSGRDVFTRGVISGLYRNPKEVP